MTYKTLTTPFAEQLERAVSITNKNPLYLRFLLAILLSVLVILVKIGLDPVIGRETPFVLALTAVLVSSWFGGVAPGLISAAITVLGIWYFFLPSYESFAMTDPRTALIELTIYLIEAGFVIYIVYRRNKAYDEMQAQTAQQAVVATIGQYGLEEGNLTSFMDRAVRAIARTVEVEYCKVLELLPDEKMLRVVAGVGFHKGVVRKALVETGPETQAGYTLKMNKPVVVTDLLKERRFVGSQLLHDHNVRSGISVMIPGYPRPYGILTIHTQKKRTFTKHDVNFMTALANVLSTTIERRLNKQAVELMATLNSELVSSLDPQQTLSGVVDTLVPWFADICEVYLKGEKNAELVEIKAVSKEKERIFREIAKRYPPSDRSKRLTAQVLRSGKSLYVPVTSPIHAKDFAQDREHERLLRQLQLLSIMIVPIKIRHTTIGTIGFGSFDKSRIYTQRDFLLAREIADRVAVAIDNANLFQEAKNAVQARDEFLSIASHELKTPLTSMLLQLQTVLHSIKNESLASFSIDKTMSMLESTISQSKRLSKLVNDLLNVSLITTGRIELERENTDLTRIVKDVAERLGEQAKKTGSTISLHAPAKIEGNWDKIRLEQVVTNLMTNAIKYGEGKPIDVEVTNSHRQATLKVIDHGMGIPKDQQDKIFDRFQRGEVKTAIKGLGVGLYLVNEIVRAHRGKIEVSSKPKEGSTFTVSLPL